MARANRRWQLHLCNIFAHADFGSGLWDGGPIGIPFVVVSNSQPLVNVTFDYSDESDPGPYPIPSDATSTVLRHYLRDAAELDGRVFFAGRLGDYAYYNMDQACARALALFEKRIAPLVRGVAEPFTVVLPA